MSGEPGSFWPRRMGAAQRRSCGVPGFEAVCVALAGAVHARRRERPVTREDQKTWLTAIALGAGRPGGRTDTWRTARRSDALDWPGDGGGHRRVAALGAAHLGRPRSAAAPGAVLQAVARSSLCRQVARRGRALSRSAGPQPGAVGR